MKKSDFYYELPQQLIAQTPVEPRDNSRLLVFDRTESCIEHKTFYSICDYLREGDCLILNDTRVLPARLYGIKEETGARVEFLLLSQRQNDVWEVMAGPGKRAKTGSKFIFGGGMLKCEILDVLDGGNRLAKFYFEGGFFSVLDEIGHMPLPPYITEKLGDKERYQTVYSKRLGSAAAPTAGLHFTNGLLDKIREKGVATAFVTLHVGLGTFRPVKVDNIKEHKMHSEHYCVPAAAADIINKTKQRGGRVIAVGTTSCRTLESAAKPDGRIEPGEGTTDIFIYPGYKFKCVDALITNFHLPESTLIMLVSAFCGYENTMTAYKTAVEEKYRFFSFGDAMLIL